MNTPKNTPEEKNEKSLKGILGDSITERIRNINRYDRPVLFVGYNLSLIRNAVDYLRYTHGQGMPTHVLSCAGLKEDEVLAKLKEWWIDSSFTNREYYTELGGMLFLECLNPYENVLVELLSEVAGNKEPKLLVIGMGNKGNLSQELLDQFEVIELEPKKKKEQAKYDNQSKRIYWNGKYMNCKGKMKEILCALDKPRDLSYILRTFYDQNCNKGEKIHDHKRNSFDTASSRLNERYKKTFGVSYDLIEIQNKTVTRNLDIQW